MKWWISICLSLLLGCQPPAVTRRPSVEQGSTDCTPSRNYPLAKLPPISYFTGQGPTAGPTQIFVAFADPFVKGEYVAYLADYAAGKIPWGTRVTSEKLHTLTAWLATQVPPGRPTLIGPNPPPPPPPCPGCDDDYLARFTLGVAVRLPHVFAGAAADAKLPSGIEHK
jgi:hypothetical protein